MRREPAPAALRTAVARRRPGPGLIHHADRGARHAATAYRGALAAIGARRSMSRKGDPFDNAPMEGFLKTPKAELVDDADCATQAEARRDVFVFLAAWCDRQPSHSAIGYVTPNRMERTAA